MDFNEFKTGQNDITRRIDKVIRLFAPSLSLSEIYKAIRKGLIRVNNKKTKAEYRIEENDTIFIASFLLNKDINSQKEELKSVTNKKTILIEPDIVFENEHIIIINKPYNINVHGDDNSLDKVIKHYYKTHCSSSSLSFKPGPLHRLDRNTTGLLAFSKSLVGAHWFSENIQSHIIQKKYYGLVNGKLKNEEAWTDFISKEDNDKSSFHKVIAKKIDKEINLKDDDEKIAKTIATPISYGKFNNDDVTLVCFNIKTGRKHQIRAQSALHGHSLLGDTAYGSKKLKEPYQEFYLTAFELSFPKDNPIGLPDRITIDLPKQFIQILKYCGISKTVV